MHDQADRTHLSRLLRHFLAVVSGNYGALVATFVISIVLTRRLGVELFGQLSLLLMVSQVLQLIIGNWTQVGLVRFGAQEFAAEGTVARTFWARIFVSGPVFAVSVAALVMARSPLASYLGVPEWSLALVLGHYILTYTFTTVGAIFQARQEMMRYGTLIFCERVLSLALVALLPSSWIRNSVAVLACYGLSALVLSVWGILMVGRQTFLPLDFDRRAYGDLLRFSAPFILTSWLGLLGAHWLDLILLKWFRSLADVGLYALAGQLAGVIQQVTITFSTLLLPHFSVLVGNGDEHRIRVFLDRILPYWFLVISVLFSVAALAAGPLLPLMFGEAFAGALPPLVLLIVASSALALYNAFDPLFSAYGATAALAKVFLLSVSVKVILTWLWIPRWGLTGAAFGTVCGYLVCAVFTMFLVQRRTGSRIMKLALFVIPVAVVCLSVLYLPGNYAPLAALAGGAACLYAVSTWFQLFQSEDRQLLKEIWNGALQGNVGREA